MNLCFSFMQSTRRLALGRQGPTVRVPQSVTCRRLLPSPLYHQTLLRNVIAMDPRVWQRHTSNTPFVYPAPLSWGSAGEPYSSCNHVVFPITSYSPTSQTLATEFIHLYAPRLSSFVPPHTVKSDDSQSLLTWLLLLVALFSY
jgi:hypothetical protein